MLVVDNCIVSENIIDICFVCDIEKCKGICCVEGDAGAPLDEEEIGLLEDNYEAVKPYMTQAGIDAIDLNGSVFDYDIEGDFVTPLINNCECAFLIMEEGIAKCAIEKAWERGEADFQKPISCHLYPIRITKYKEFDAINYHAWYICKDALQDKQQFGVPIYKFLEVPLTRKYGKEWYRKLQEQADIYKASKH